MVKRTINNHEVVFYDNIEDLPIVQLHRYSKYLLVEGGIGDSIQDIDKHITRILNLLGDMRKVHQEILNLRQCIYFVANEQDIQNKATLCLVKSVDGKEWEDFSDDGLDSLYRLVNKATQRELNEIAKEVRERIDSALLQYFPSIFEDTSQKNYADLLRERAALQIASIVNGDDNEEKIKGITDRIFKLHDPKDFSGADGEEVRFDKQFEDMCLLMASEFGGGIKKFTTMEFYTAYERLLKQNKEAKKLKNRRK